MPDLNMPALGSDEEATQGQDAPMDLGGEVAQLPAPPTLTMAGFITSIDRDSRVRTVFTSGGYCFIDLDRYGLYL